MSIDETVKIRATVGLLTSVRSYTEAVLDTGETPEDWAEMGEEARNQIGDEVRETWVRGLLDGTWEVVGS